MMLSLDLVVVSHFCHGELSGFKLTYGYGDAGCGMECSLPVSESEEKKETIKQSVCCLDLKFDIRSDSFHSVQTIQTLPELTMVEALASNGCRLVIPRFLKNFSHCPSPAFAQRVSLSMIQVFLN